MKKLSALLSSFVVMPCFALPIDLPQIPFPAPGSDEILFVVRNVTENVDVSIKDYWSNRNVKRTPFKDVKNQSIMSTSGSKWLSAFVTVSVNGHDYTMAAVSGYKDAYSTVYTNVAAQDVLNKTFSDVTNFVGENKSQPWYAALDEQQDYFVNTEVFDSGSGTVISLCISDKKTLHQCQTQN
ncbi:thermostable direct hemolysin (plasmid) [Photobacterium damselae subsp. damselae]|uniref:thermostable direct hemolysin-family toxin n=1 Tax=Photobacterium damselae TaxID=38293 RepID=UPI001010913D|nr:thermostable direct hemolysin-family toxin [Photobacterium damselae]QAY37718.1 thermostable direct hemolysin [Photobacterium damselae subsp. damselae]